jgi:hypothetical protein
MDAAPVPPPMIPVLAERGGTQLKAPRGVVLVDTREQRPFDFSRFACWFSGIEQRALALGDYSVAGLEDSCVVERKGLDDLIHSFTAERSTFIDRLRRMSSFPHRLLVVTAALSQIKSPYPHSGTNPNWNGSVPDRTAHWFARAFRDYRKSRAGRRDRRLLSLPGSSLPPGSKRTIMVVFSQTKICSIRRNGGLHLADMLSSSRSA